MKKLFTFDFRYFRGDLFVGLEQQPKYMMEPIDIIPDLIPSSQIFESFEDCVHWLRNYVADER